MSLKSPYATKIEEGAYSAIVIKEGDLIIAKDTEGGILKESTNGATVIQAAIDSCDKMGKVVLTDLFDINAELTFPSLAWTSFASGITLQGYGNKSGINYTPATGYAIKMEATASNCQCVHHILDNLITKAPNTTDAVIGILGGVRYLDLRNIRVFNCPNGKGVYTYHSATLGGNILHMSSIAIYHCKYGIYATGGPSLSIDGRSYIKTLTADGGLEAMYYTVDGHTGDGFKQFHTDNLEIGTQTAAQRTMYVKGDRYSYSSHNNLYDDGGKPMYLDGGRHAFYSCYIGELDWSVGTVVEVDRGNRGCELKAKDSMYCIAELRTPFRVDATSNLAHTTGTSANDAAAANGKCVQLDAQNELWGFFFGSGNYRFNKYMGRGKYLLTIYAKDSAQVTTDLNVYIQGSNGGAHHIAEKNYTLQAAYAPIPHMFTLDSNDLEDMNVIFLTKRTATANIISIDYISLEHVGTDFHQSLGGGHQYLYLSDGGTLPTATVNLRGVVTFQPGAAGVADTMKMCMKSAADTYSWKTIVTG